MTAGGPLLASVAVAYRCNSRCSYCGIWKQRVVDPDPAQLKRVFEELAELGVGLVSLTGGEPTLRPDLHKIVQSARSEGLRCSVTTNGLLLDEQRLRQLASAGLDSVILSLDTLDPRAYMATRGVSIDRALAALETAASLQASGGPRVSVNAVMSPANMGQLRQLGLHCLRLQVALGVQPLHASFGRGVADDAPREAVFDREKVREDVEALLEMQAEGLRLINSDQYLHGAVEYAASGTAPQGFRCTAGLTSLAIDVHGAVRVCWGMAPLGHVSQGLRQLWDSEGFRRARALADSGRCPQCWLSCHLDERTMEWLTEHLGME